VSRYKLPAKVGICQVIQSFIGSTSAVSGYNDYMGHVIESSLLKNRDKQMTFIVRVSRSAFFFYIIVFYWQLSLFQHN